ncbi:MAG: TetR/AcrR family transcriptional repressor of nem operon [Saprospiraceae bacterium]|jgi:TetR/AcrR family transcriptional repressor of nem operon
MKRSTRNPAKTKQTIIERSAPVFNVHGFAGTKMQMLVDATGYQMGGIYKHFGTKLDLAIAVFDYNYTILIRKTLEVDPNLESKEQVLAMLLSCKSMVARPTIKGGCPILNTAIESDDTNPRLRELAKSRLKEVCTAIEMILTQGIENGQFNNSIDPKSEALYIVATIEGAIMIGNLLKSAAAVFGIFDTLEQYLARNIFHI